MENREFVLGLVYQGLFGRPGGGGLRGRFSGYLFLVVFCPT